MLSYQGMKLQVSILTISVQRYCYNAVRQDLPHHEWQKTVVFGGAATGASLTFLHPYIVAFSCLLVHDTKPFLRLHPNLPGQSESSSSPANLFKVLWFDFSSHGTIDFNADTPRFTFVA